jgi:hypothetical protein
MAENPGQKTCMCYGMPRLPYLLADMIGTGTHGTGESVSPMVTNIAVADARHLAAHRSDPDVR